MITFGDFKNMHEAPIPGRARKIQSDNLMLNTWWQDIQAQTCYIYDYYHDQKSYEALKLNDLHPESDPQKKALPIKFIRHSKQTYDKDQVTFWLQMQPGQKCNLDYYDEVLGKRYDSIFPIGTYVDIMHEDGTYNKWLVVDKANYNGNQYPTFEILRCDFVAQWIYKGKKYQCPAVLRSQNSQMLCDTVQKYIVVKTAFIGKTPVGRTIPRIRFDKDKYVSQCTINIVDTNTLRNVRINIVEQIMKVPTSNRERALFFLSKILNEYILYVATHIYTLSARKGDDLF